MPFEIGSNGAYRKSMLSGTINAGVSANGELWQYRWTDATRLGVVHKVILDGLAGSATAFTAGFAKIDLMVARAFTAASGTGNSATLTGNNSKVRLSHGTTLLGEIRCASNTVIGAGTKTFDTDPVGQISFSIGVAVNEIYLRNVLLADNDAAHGQYPFVFAQNEGLSIRQTVPATGTWQFGVSVIWAEVDSF